MSSFDFFFFSFLFFSNPIISFSFSLYPFSSAAHRAAAFASRRLELLADALRSLLQQQVGLYPTKRHMLGLAISRQGYSLSSHTSWPATRPVLKPRSKSDNL
jgi:hypothetical protein